MIHAVSSQLIPEDQKTVMMKEVPNGWLAFVTALTLVFFFSLYIVAGWCLVKA
eukprot:gene564-612_t